MEPGEKIEAIIERYKEINFDELSPSDQERLLAEINAFTLEELNQIRTSMMISLIRDELKYKTLLQKIIGIHDIKSGKKAKRENYRKVENIFQKLDETSKKLDDPKVIEIIKEIEDTMSELGFTSSDFISIWEMVNDYCSPEIQNYFIQKKAPSFTLREFKTSFSNFTDEKNGNIYLLNTYLSTLLSSFDRFVEEEINNPELSSTGVITQYQFGLALAYIDEMKKNNKLSQEEALMYKDRIKQMILERLSTFFQIAEANKKYDLETKVIRTIMYYTFAFEGNMTPKDIELRESLIPFIQKYIGILNRQVNKDGYEYDYDGIVSYLTPDEYEVDRRITNELDKIKDTTVKPPSF